MVFKASEKKKEEHDNETRELNDMLDFSKSLQKHTKFSGKVDTRIAEGDPRQVLVQQAIAVGADYLVIGNRGLGKVTSMLGSVSDYVVRHAPCPVIVVRDTSK